MESAVDNTVYAEGLNTNQAERETSSSATVAEAQAVTGEHKEATEEARTVARQSSSSSGSDRIEGVHITVGTYLEQGLLTRLEAKKVGSSLRSMDSSKPHQAPLRPAHEEYRMYESQSRLDEIMSQEAQSITLKGAIYSGEGDKPDTEHKAATGRPFSAVQLDPGLSEETSGQAETSTQGHRSNAQNSGSLATEGRLSSKLRRILYQSLRAGSLPTDVRVEEVHQQLEQLSLKKTGLRKKAMATEHQEAAQGRSRNFAFRGGNLTELVTQNQPLKLIPDYLNLHLDTAEPSHTTASKSQKVLRAGASEGPPKPVPLNALTSEKEASSIFSRYSIGAKYKQDFMRFLQSTVRQGLTIEKKDISGKGELPRSVSVNARLQRAQHQAFSHIKLDDKIRPAAPAPRRPQREHSCYQNAETSSLNLTDQFSQHMDNLKLKHTKPARIYSRPYSANPFHRQSSRSRTGRVA